MASRTRSLLGNLALLAGALIFSCGSGEIALRYLRPQPLEAAYMWPDGTLRHIPSLSHVYARQEFANPVRYNALGLRGPEVPATKRPGVPRVLFLGDSFVEGKQVAEEALLTSALRRMSERDGRPLEVLNAGVSGTGTSEEMILWDRLGRGFAPDLVLLGFYPNDVRNNSDRGLFALTDGGVAAVKEMPQPKVRAIYDVRKFLASRSHLYMLLREGWDLVEERWASRTPRGAAGAERASSAGDAVEARGDPMEAEEVFESAPSPRVRRGWDLTVALLSELRRRVEMTGARFAVVVFPSRFQVDDALWRDHARALGIEPGAFDLRKPSTVLAEWSRDTGATVIDLLDLFRSRNVSNSFYFSIDGHWNPEGHRLAAEGILAGLKAEGLL